MLIGFNHFSLEQVYQTVNSAPRTIGADDATIDPVGYSRRNSLIAWASACTVRHRRSG
jgi:hypothetical protein